MQHFWHIRRGHDKGKTVKLQYPKNAKKFFDDPTATQLLESLWRIDWEDQDNVELTYLVTSLLLVENGENENADDYDFADDVNVSGETFYDAIDFEEEYKDPKDPIDHHESREDDEQNDHEKSDENEDINVSRKEVLQIEAATVDFQVCAMIENLFQTEKIKPGSIGDLSLSTVKLLQKISQLVYGNGWTF